VHTFAFFQKFPSLFDQIGIRSVHAFQVVNFLVCCLKGAFGANWQTGPANFELSLLSLLSSRIVRIKGMGNVPFASRCFQKVFLAAQVLDIEVLSTSSYILRNSPLVGWVPF
jgi:hypothetical protein